MADQTVVPHVSDFLQDFAQAWTFLNKINYKEIVFFMGYMERTNF